MSQPIPPSYTNPDQSEEVTEGLAHDDARAAIKERLAKSRAVSDEEYLNKYAAAQAKVVESDDAEAATWLSSLAGGPISGLLETARTFTVDASRAATITTPGGTRIQPLPFLPNPDSADVLERGLDTLDKATETAFGDPNKAGIGVGLIWGVGQFAAGSKLLKAARLGKAVAGVTKLDDLGNVTRLGRVVKGATQGAAVDFAAFDPEDNMLAEAAARLPGVGPLFEQLRANPDDPELVKRLKSTLIGMGIGVGTEHIFAGLKAVAMKTRFRKMLEDGTLRHGDFDPEGLRAATDLAQVRALFHDSKKVVGVASDIAELAESGRLGTFEGTERRAGRAQVRVSQAAPTDMAMSKADPEGAARPGDDPTIMESTEGRKVDGLTDRQRAAVEHAKAEREQLRLLKGEVEDAWKAYTETDGYKRLRPDVKRALNKLANNENPRVDLVPNDELASEAGRRATKEAGKLAGVSQKRSGLQGFIDGPLRDNLKKWAFEGSLEENAGKGRLNLHLMGGPEETKTVFNAIRDSIIAAGKGANIQATTRSFEEEAARTAKLLGMENAEVIQMGAKLSQDTENAAATLQAMRVLVKGYGDELLSAAVDYDQALRNGFVPPELEARAFALYENAMNAYLITKSGAGNIARALSYMRAGAGEFRASVGLDDLERAKNTVFGGNVQFARVMKGIANGGSGDLAATYRWLESIEKIRKNRISTGFKAAHELFVSNTLAAVRTHTTNTIGNAGWHFMDVLERDIIATAIQRGSLSQAVKSTVAGYAAGFDGMLFLAKSMAASFRGAQSAWDLSGNANARAVGRSLDNVRRAWKTGETQLLADGSSVSEIGSYWNADYLLDEEASALAKGVVNGIGKYTGTVKSLLATADEVWANLNYFVELRRRAYLRGLDQGLSSKDGTLKKYVNTFEEHIDDAEKAEIQQKALQLARRNVFANDSPLANSLNQFGKHHVGIGLMVDYMVPFKRTPINLFKLGTERSAVAPVIDLFRHFADDEPITRQLFSKNFKQAAATEAGSEFLARYTMAGAIFASMYFAWSNGKYQGAALSTKERDQIRGQGGMEQSFMFGEGVDKSYHQVLRLDPVAIPMGIAADIFTIISHLDEDDQDAADEAQTLALALLTSMATSFKSRNYLGGLTMALDVLNAGPDTLPTKGSYWLGQMIGSQLIPNFVPHTNAQILTDGVRRDTRVYTQMGRIDAVASAVQQFKSRLGLDGDMPASRTIFGATKLPQGFVSPVPTSGPGKPTPGADEFRRLDMPVDLTAWLKEADGVVLKPGDRARFGEDFHNTLLNGRTVVQALDERVQSPAYQSLHDEARVKDLTKIVDRHKLGATAAFSRRPGMRELLAASRTYRQLTKTKGKDAARKDTRVSRLLEYYR